jgi:protein involved in polysaccharide export with SLBB domain
MASPLLLVFSSGCAILNGFLDPTKVGQFGMPGRENVVGIRRVLSVREGSGGVPNATDPTPEDLIPIYEEYRLHRGDFVFVSIDDLISPGRQQTEQQQVSERGFIRIPVLGAMKVVGWTEREFEDQIKAQLKEGKILPDPQVRVLIQAAQQRVFNILGHVVVAGTYPIRTPNMRLLEAIGAARDIGPQIKELYIIRQSETDAAPPADVEMPVDEGLVIPPPSDSDEEYSSFSSPVGMGQDTQPAGGKPKPGEDQEIKDLMEALAPRPNTASKPAGVRKSSEQPFAPLIYDPQTGKAIEVRPRDPEQTQPETGEEISPDDRAEAQEEFEWRDVPDEEQQAGQRVIRIDVRALYNGDPRQNIIVRNRDVIRVPVDTGAYYMMGEVNRPGVYGFGGREITIKQAIASAGSFGPMAFPMRCEIIRRVPGTDEQITIAVNLDAIFAGLEDDVMLKDDDIVNVGTHFVAPFLFVIRNSFRFTYGFGFVYDRNFADQDAIFGKQNPETIKRARQQARGLPF